MRRRAKSKRGVRLRTDFTERRSLGWKAEAEWNGIALFITLQTPSTILTFVKEGEMANDYDYDYRRGRNEREYYDEPYYRSQGGGDEEPYYHGSGGGERARYGHGRGRYYSEPYRRGYRGRDYSEPYGAYDYDRYEYGDRAREPYYQRRPEGESRESYYRGGYGRAEERGFIERAGDEIKSWF